MPDVSLTRSAEQANNREIWPPSKALLIWSAIVGETSPLHSLWERQPCLGGNECNRLTEVCTLRKDDPKKLSHIQNRLIVAFFVFNNSRNFIAGLEHLSSDDTLLFQQIYGQ